MRVYINKGLILAQVFLLVLFALSIAFMFPIGVSNINYGSICYALFGLICWPYLLKRDAESLVTIKFAEGQISSCLFFKKRCTVFFDRPVYVSFFKELLRSVDQYEAHDYVMVSNSPIPEFEPNSRFETFDMSTQIIFPDTEKTRQAIAPLLDGEFCIIQGSDPPPVEELRKKKEKKKEEPPVDKREQSPDDPPPFTGKWNGRF